MRSGPSRNRHPPAVDLLPRDPGRRAPGEADHRGVRGPQGTAGIVAPVLDGEAERPPSLHPKVHDAKDRVSPSGTFAHLPRGTRIGHDVADTGVEAEPDGTLVGNQQVFRERRRGGNVASVTAAKAASPSAAVRAVTSSADRSALLPVLNPATEPGPATPPLRRTVNLRTRCASRSTPRDRRETRANPVGEVQVGETDRRGCVHDDLALLEDLFGGCDFGFAGLRTEDNSQEGHDTGLGCSTLADIRSSFLEVTGAHGQVRRDLAVGNGVEWRSLRPPGAGRRWPRQAGPHAGFHL